MNPEWLSALSAPTSQERHRDWEAISARLARADEEVSRYARLVYAGDLIQYSKVKADLKRQYSRELGAKCDAMVALALAEYISPHVCPSCHGVGQIGLRICPACKGNGRAKRTDLWRARILGIEKGKYRRKYAALYGQLTDHIERYERIIWCV